MEVSSIVQSEANKKTHWARPSAVNNEKTPAKKTPINVCHLKIKLISIPTIFTPSV